MKSHLGKIEEIVTNLNSDIEKGLNDSEVIESRNLSGENTFTKEKEKNIFKRILEALMEPMTFILIIAAAITIGVNLFKVFNNQYGEFVEAVGILIAIALSTTITVFMEGRSKKAFEVLNKIKENIAVKAIRNGYITLVPQKELVVGDIIQIETGDKIPVDARLIESIELQVDEASLTGESLPVNKRAKEIIKRENTPLAERFNMIYGGTYITAGSGKAIVTDVGDNTEFGKIAEELKKQDKTSTPLQEKLTKLGKAISIVGISLATFILIIQLIKLYLNNSITFDNVSEAFISSIVLIVAAVPEGLPTIVTASLAINIIKMAKENALVKNLVASETVGGINIICSDKTGTLTENKMIVIKIYEKGKFINPQKLEDEAMINNFGINTSAHLEVMDKGGYKFIGSPTEGALLVVHDQISKESYLSARKKADVAYSYPFASETKNMTTILKKENKLIAYTKGSTEKIIHLCNKIAVNGEIKDLKDYLANLEEQVYFFENQGMRLIGFAHKELEEAFDFKEERKKIEADMIFDGFVVIKDPIRKEVYDSINICRSAGVSIKMLTGDNIITAKAIAGELGIIDENSLVLNAQDVENMKDEELGSKIDRIKVIARSTPLIKLRIVNMLKKKGNVVAVTGDGINDALAIKSADVGIAMGITGTEVSKEASDIVLLDDSFATIVKAIKWGRGIYENFQRFIQFQLTVNLSSVIVIVTIILIGFASPFNAIDILWINLIMDGPPALTLGLEPIRNDLIKNKPTERKASIVTKRMMLNIIVNGLFMSAVLLLQKTTNFMRIEENEMGTVIFTLFVFFQLVNAFNSRELGNTSIFKNIASNKIMLIVFTGTFLLQVLITQFGGTVFNAIPLGLLTWGKTLLIAASILLVSEVVKLINRIRENRHKKKI